MFDSVAFNVVIGLIFIYLLYSLFATVLSEIIATKLALRSRNLKEAVNRMLNDEEKTGWLKRLWDSFNILKNPKNDVINKFYKHPEIKYLGSSGLFPFPSAYKSVSFSKTLLSMLFGNGELTKDTIDKRLDEIIKASTDNKKDQDKDKPAVSVFLWLESKWCRLKQQIRAFFIPVKNSSGTDSNNISLDKDTAEYIKSLWIDSYGDITKFKFQLEGWFDRTMEQATEWYKRKIQVVLLVIGFLIAWFFNADTFVIIEKLSTDKDAREKIVSMANAYVENNKVVTGPVLNNDSLTASYSAKLDSLLEVKKKLQMDINDANSILGLGGWPPDTVKVSADIITGARTYHPPVDIAALTDDQKNTTESYIAFTGKKWCYFFRLFCPHFFGFLITAIAISLGAPFWFDLLNKMMRLRTAAKQETDTAAASSSGTGVSPLNREG